MKTREGRKNGEMITGRINNIYCFKHRQKDVRNMKSDGRKAKE